MSSPEDLLARRIAEHMLASEGTGPEWGIVIEEARVGYARLRMAVRPNMTNGHATAHGGILFALADTAFAYACNSHNRNAVAASASIVFLAPAKEGDILIAEANEQAAIGRSGACSVAVSRNDGTPVAHFQGLSRIVGGPILTDSDGEDDHG